MMDDPPTNGHRLASKQTNMKMLIQIHIEILIKMGNKIKGKHIFLVTEPNLSNLISGAPIGATETHLSSFLRTPKQKS